MKKKLLRVLLVPFVMLTIVSLSFAAKIHLKNGSVIGGEIISFDDTSVTIKEPVMGNMKVSREKIININPPLRDKEVKQGTIEPEISKPEPLEPAKRVALPQFSKRAIQEPKPLEFLAERREKRRISVYLAGGMSNIINGGDSNGVIRDYKQLINDWNVLYSTDYTADWKEFEWIQDFKGEIFFNLSPSISFGLGVEYLDTKKNKGKMTLNDENSGTFDGGLYYYNYSLKDNYSFEPEQRLIAIPITFNFYYFIPIGKIAEFFLKGGFSYYIATLKYNETYQSDYEYQADYYASDDTFWYTYIDNYTENGTYSYKVKCKETGFQAGVGFDVKLFSFLSIVAEGTYRFINLKDWNGNGTDSWSWDEEWGRSDLGYSTDSGNDSESSDGKIWYYELYDPDLDNQYGFLSLHEEEPQTSEFIKNTRPAEIKLNGYSLRVGIKISF